MAEAGGRARGRKQAAMSEDVGFGFSTRGSSSLVDGMTVNTHLYCIFKGNWTCSEGSSRYGQLDA